MPKRRGPIETGWSVLWLLAAGCIVLWLLVRVLEQVWPWLVGGLLVFGVFWTLVSWLRSRGRL